MRKAAKLLAGRAAVVQVETDQSPTVSGRYGIRGIPAVHLLIKGKSVDQLTGSRTAEDVVAWFRRTLQMN